MYVAAAYCYRLSIAWSVGLSVTVVSHAKTAEPIEMTRVGQRNHVMDGGSDPPWEGVILRGKGTAHCEV